MADSLHIVCPHCLATNRIPAQRLADGGSCGRCKQPLLTGRPFDLTSANAQQHLQHSDLPVVVDFWASWCGPCRMFAPAFEQAAEAFNTRARFAKLDTEAEPELASRYNIRSIPTLIVLRRGQELARQGGAMDFRRFTHWLDSVLS